MTKGRRPGHSRLHLGDGGFTIIESMVALVIIFGLMLTLLRTFDVSADLVVLSNRRSNATTLASELIERSRSLEWEHMGLTSTANGSTCPSDVGCSTHPASITSQISSNANGNYTFDGEEIVFANGVTFDPFLTFTETVTRDDVDFDRFLFVSSVRSDPLDPATERVRRITAVVRWGTGNAGGEIRLVTYVSEFVEPSQPFVLGEIQFDGGFVSVRGSEGRCSGNPECGAFVQGSSDFAGATARDDMEAELYFADASMMAVTDYVSSASYRGSGSAADVRWAGPDGLVTTPDDILYQVVQSVLAVFVDDDASSLPLTNEPRTFPTALTPGVNLSPAAPADLVIADLDDSGDLDTTTNPDLDDASIDGEAWTQHDTDPGPAVTDGLPYVAAELDAAETTRIGFIEYADAAVRTFYATHLGSSLNDASYEFVLGRTGDNSGEALEYEGTVDRYDDMSSNRQVHNTATWTGEVLYIAYDDVLGHQPSAHVFEGWVRITLPEIATTTIKAGESAPYPPTVSISQDLVVEFWDAASTSYDIVFSGFSSMQCAASSVTVSYTTEYGGPQSFTASKPMHPQISYEVDAEVVIQPYCPTHTLDANGDVALADVSLAQMVTGTVAYKVTDDLMAVALGDGLMFDLAIDFDGGGLDTTAIFVNPDL